MYSFNPGLTQAKQDELAQACSDARDEIVGRDLALRAQIHPLTQEPGLTLPITAPIADANLTILQHKVNGCIQFAFPVQGAQPVPQLTPQAPDYAFGFIRPRQLSDGLTAGGLLDWGVKAALHVVQDSVSLAVVREIEQHSRPEGFIALGRGYRAPATQAELAAAKNQQVLLFVHGIFSSTGGAFADLGDTSGASCMQQLLARYGNRVFGYDHWTISKTPLQNAIDMLNAMPADANWDVDIVCHSRGGLVVRSLLSLPTADARPANPDLLRIAALRAGRIRSVGKAYFVAAANQGSPLADPDDIRNFLNVAAMLASGSSCLALDVVIGLAKYVVSSGFSLPSVQQLNSGSSLVQDLNSGATMLDAASTYFVRGDFDFSTSPLLSIGVYLDRYLMKVDNDLVVPYDGLSMPEFAALDQHWLNFGTPGAKQGKVWHTEFFGQQQTQTFLRNGLL
jgi:hypothetical protein